MKRFWNIWAKALGEKASNCDNESDKVAWIRTFLILQAVITNLFIIANFFYDTYILRHYGTRI